MLSAPDIERPEPRWPAVIGVLAAAILHFALPEHLRIGPPWLLVGLVALLLVIAWTARHLGLHHVNAKAGYAILALLTAGLLYGLAMLMSGLVHHTITAPDLLRAAAVLWATNVLVFATWYWRLDAGGPNRRERQEAHTRGAFLFPQMAVDAPHDDAGDGDSGATIAKAEGWRPGFVDYLFVAFNTSTAFSPTDVPVLSRWAKLTMMVQATISVVAVVLLVGRAVNIL
jgi:hypothetical protein